MKSIKLFTIFVLILFSVSCSHKITKILPAGNVKEINCKKDDIAPVQKPLNVSTNCDICSKEQRTVKIGENDKIQSSAKYVQEMISNQNPNITTSKEALQFLNQNVESLTFTSESTGFVSISHPPDAGYAEKINLPMEGIVGGTDIFEFTNENGKYVFRNLGSEINSEFWDSHPFAINDSNCNTLLVWSSDRYDIANNLSLPYTNNGNADLFYAFKINGKWSSVKSFSTSGDSINLKRWNEFSPFITCLCKSPILFFASNRDGHYNIYKTGLLIDFDNQLISSDNKIEKLDKKINSGANQLFPFITNPLTNDSYIYFSSDRYKDSIFKSKDTVIKNVGMYDIYKFPYYVDCKDRIKQIHPPKTVYKIKYHIVVKSLEKNSVVEEPLFINTEIGGIKQEMKNGDTIDFAVFTKVKTYGGSLYEDNSVSSQSILNYYQYRKITKLQPEIKSREIIQMYDTIVNPKYKTVLDTMCVDGALVSSAVASVKNNPLCTYKTVIFKDPKFNIIFAKKELVKQDTIQKKRILIAYDTLQRFDTTFIKITKETPAGSVLTNKGFSLKAIPTQDIIIFDTIYIQPRYYKCPQCRWVYNELKKVEKKNVPFFQTGMWEVNTGENLKRHLVELVSKEFSGASFIELQPEHQKFGYRDPSFDEQQVAGRKAKREQRISEYRVFADSVDKFMGRMANDISNKILPEFSELLTKAPNNKLIIQVYGYSDIRPILRGWYTGDKTVKYYTLNFDETLGKIINDRLYKVEIRPHSSMVGEKNDTLSKLRAYSGYTEIKKMLMKDARFKEFVDRGEVFFPDECVSEANVADVMSKSKIIFQIEGKQVDPSLIPEINDYKDRKNDLYILDAIRRVNIIINRIEYQNGNIEAACCGD